MIMKFDCFNKIIDTVMFLTGCDDDTATNVACEIMELTKDDNNFYDDSVNIETALTDGFLSISK